MSESPIRYFATCARGLEGVVATELEDPRIGAASVTEGSSGVYFTGTPATGYRANLWLRSGVRVLAEHARANVRGPEELYTWARALPWTKLLRAEQTFSVEARVWDSAVTHSKYAALRIKDALCDSFRDKTGARPDVDVHRADLPLFLYLFKDQATLYRDLSGTTLHKRGYRDALHKSSLNECVVAAALQITGWHGQHALLDPMCGSGTFGIEAALIALNRAPGLARERWPFESWPDFDAQAWREAKKEARAAARETIDAPIFLNDVHRGAVSLARKDAAAAGVDRFIEFANSDVAEYVPPAVPGTVITNPPWGERLKSEDPSEPWRKLGRFLKDRCRPSTAWIFSGNAELTRHLGMKADRRYPVMLGKTDCRLLKYEIHARAGAKDAAP